MSQPELTYEWFRSRGFRLQSTQSDNQPHMVLIYDSYNESAIEVTPTHSGDWHCWLRSDLAHSRCRFVHLRHLQRPEQVERLVAALSDRDLCEVDYDPVQFRLSLESERDDCQRRYQEYCRNERYGRVPG